MNLLLAGSFDDAERDQWRQLLSQALPRHHLVTPGELFDRTRIEVAIVANPPRESLVGLPRLRLIQSLWAGVDRLLDDPTHFARSFRVHELRGSQPNRRTVPGGSVSVAEVVEAKDVTKFVAERSHVGGRGGNGYFSSAEVCLPNC